MTEIDSSRDKRKHDALMGAVFGLLFFVFVAQSTSVIWGYMDAEVIDDQAFLTTGALLSRQGL